MSNELAEQVAAAVIAEEDPRVTVYLSGPMRGYPNNNFEAFHAARQHLRREGYRVLCPAESSIRRAAAQNVDVDNIPFEEYMREEDIPAVLESDMIMVLPGWEKSVGARTEVLVGQVVGVPTVLYADRWSLVHLDLEGALNTAVEKYT